MQRSITLAGCTLLLMLLGVTAAGAQTVIGVVPIPASSAGVNLAVNPALNRIYVAAGFSPGSLTVVDGLSLSVVTTISDVNGVTVDTQNDNYWTANLFGGQVLTYSGITNTQIAATTVGYCPGELTFDCRLRRVWAGAQCGAGNDPVFVFDADTLALIAGPIGTGGIMGPMVANPNTGKLYVTASGVSKEVDPITFAVTSTGFGTVQAVDAVTNRLFAVQGSRLQIINGANDTVVNSVQLGYATGSVAVNNALGHIYIVNGNGHLIEVRSETGRLLGTFLLGLGNTPISVAADPIRGRVYASVSRTGGYLCLWAIEDLTSAPKCGHRGGP